MSDTPRKNTWGDIAGLAGFLACLMCVAGIWTTGTTRENFFFTGLFFVVISVAAAIPGLKAHNRNRDQT